MDNRLIKWTLYLNFDENFLSPFQIIYRFCYLCDKYSSRKQEIKNVILENNIVWSYLKRINFDCELWKLFWIKSIISSWFTWNLSSLIEIRTYQEENDFYQDVDKIYTILKNVWIDENMSREISQQILWEIVRNCFEHNDWCRNKIWPCMWLMWHFSGNKLDIFLFDIWIWLSWSLKEKFPDTWDEFDYIKLAIQEWVSSRPNSWIQPDWSINWWLGLHFLQHYVIERYWWTVYVVSNAHYTSIKGDVEKIVYTKKLRNKFSWTIIWFRVYI